MNAAELTFEALRGADTYLSTLAYWCGLLAPAPWPPQTDGPGLHSAMSYQYDIEEQAGYTGRLFPVDADWRTTFGPLAPVQLTEAWSPMPYACDVLGPPAWLHAEESGGARAVGAAWLASSLEQVRAAGVPRGASADQRRFLQILTVGAMRGLEQGRGLLLAACPGWSYLGCHPFDAATQGYMRRARFVVTDRHPPPSGAT